ncbi:rhodanese-like domain-containing protein [Flavobacterium araucananum]|uniref:Sulfurtransferase n=1 Tax=Flavobacterium araucananum TaxID=946678 RepID=A0A227NX23_9FLAO|nr:rhodanese-like domain-containing protein [Flavobacterium araucananum]OXG01714.1 sulfurtransferase [Flavobacterium araucananum]PWK00453.1 rhodanese-like domain-containing protein [Flavobacterium araucananum]
MKKIIFIYLVISCLTSCIVHSQTPKNKTSMKEQKHYPKALVDYSDFKNLVLEVEKERVNRLVSLEDFLKMSQEYNTIVLDTRSDFRYNRKHLKGAIHLDFTDFTQENLYKLIPDNNTRILIYCNNNFDGDQIDFASKMLIPKNAPETQILANRKPIMLALNIPTHINLYGYDYKNVYELDELVNVNDARIKFEGTEVK